MADVASLLQASLHPTTRKQAEQQLQQLTTQDGFLSHLLQLILNRSVDPSIRLAGGIYLKNIAKLKWEEVSILLLCNSTRVERLAYRTSRLCQRRRRRTSAHSSFHP